MSSALPAVAIPGWVSAERVFAELLDGRPHAFWLDSGADAARGWSYLGEGVPVSPEEVRGIRIRGAGASGSADPWDRGGETGLRRPGSDAGSDAEEAGPGSADEASPFRGGYVGWEAYEEGARAVGAPVAETGEGSSWMRVTWFLALDHERRRVWLFDGGGPRRAERVARLCAESAGTVSGDPSDISEAPRGSAAVDDGSCEDAERARSHGEIAAADVTPPMPVPGGRTGGERLPAFARHDPTEYAALVARCREEIRLGNAYQLCLTTRFSVPGAHDPASVFGALRRSSPSHHAAFIRIGERTLLSASPEQFLGVEHGRVRTSPIKGTRPRSADAAEDAALAAALLASEKERAENVMIVDLMRNDLSRVCEPGSVRVDRLWQVESYPAVHQLVSTVSGRLVGGTTVGGLLAATFPAGSMTGAPKLAAMEILHELEGDPRGAYAGCFGWISEQGSLDLGMTIRTIVLDPDGASVGAGGGITWGSVPKEEVAEVAIKASAPLAALGARLPGPWEAAKAR